MKISLEAELCNHLARARGFGHVEAQWLATRVLASRTMNEAQIAMACIRLEKMLSSDVISVRACRTDIIEFRDPNRSTGDMT